jgi:hypothetical protein
MVAREEDTIMKNCVRRFLVTLTLVLALLLTATLPTAAYAEGAMLTPYGIEAYFRNMGLLEVEVMRTYDPDLEEYYYDVNVPRARFGFLIEEVEPGYVSESRFLELVDGLHGCIYRNYMVKDYLQSVGLDFRYLGESEENGVLCQRWERFYGAPGVLCLPEYVDEFDLPELVEAQRTFFFPWEAEPDFHGKQFWTLDGLRLEFGYEEISYSFAPAGDPIIADDEVIVRNSRNGITYIAKPGDYVFEDGKILLHDRFVTKLVTGGKF